MCLILKKKARVETSPVAITVYKRLSLSGKAPFRPTKYYTGELKTVKNFTVDNSVSGCVEKVVKVLPNTAHFIYKGFHVYETKRRAQMFGRCGLVVECKIPRYTPFIRGRNGQIVTLGLRVGKAVGKRNYGGHWSETDFFARQFNTIKKRKK